MRNPKTTDRNLIQDNLEAEDFLPETTANDMFEGVTITNAQEVAGRGLLATLTLSQAISDKLPGKFHNVHAINVFLGNQEWMNENYARYQNRRLAKECSELLGNWQDQGQSIVLVSALPVGGNKSIEHVGTHSDGCKNACACVVCHCSSKSVCCTASQTMMIVQFVIADIPRPEAAQLITKLRKRKIEVWMITGDNERTGQVIGEKLGIPKGYVLAGIKPEQNSDKIRNLQRRGTRGHSVHCFWRKNESQPETAVVAMVGDGINYSPALALADVGISVGSATDIAIEAASIVLIRNNLMDLLTMYDISKTVVHRIRLNFLWAFLYNVFVIPIAAGIPYPACGQGLPTYVAGLAMIASSVSVVCSSLLLKLYKAPKIVEESHQLKI
ncbi:HAD-like protein [Backusella circina FSU 941]|nr:HAD-like protein [Backusella circina FSU 941]